MTLVKTTTSRDHFFKTQHFCYVFPAKCQKPNVFVMLCSQIVKNRCFLYAFLPFSSFLQCQAFFASPLYFAGYREDDDGNFVDDIDFNDDEDASRDNDDGAAIDIAKVRALVREVRGMKVAEIRERLGRYHVDVRGLKPTLVSRLLEVQGVSPAAYDAVLESGADKELIVLKLCVNPAPGVCRIDI